MNRGKHAKFHVREIYSGFSHFMKMDTCFMIKNMAKNELLIMFHEILFKILMISQSPDHEFSSQLFSCEENKKFFMFDEKFFQSC